MQQKSNSLNNDQNQCTTPCTTTWWLHHIHQLNHLSGSKNTPTKFRQLTQFRVIPIYKIVTQVPTSCIEQPYLQRRPRALTGNMNLSTYVSLNRNAWHCSAHNLHPIKWRRNHTSHHVFVTDDGLEKTNSQDGVPRMAAHFFDWYQLQGNAPSETVGNERSNQFFTKKQKIL